MRSKSVSAAVLASLTLSLLLLRAASVWAADPAKEKELVPDGVRKQFQWEEKVVGPQSDKRIDHAKIAAIQEQARKDEANQKNAAPTRKQAPARAEGIAAPSTATLPTMDIEKPAPAGSIKMPAKKTAAKAEAPKSHDAIDDYLAMNNASDQPKTRTAMPFGRPEKTRRAKHAHAHSRRRSH
ncbi:MAG TPA: hypothetical protein VNO55_06260 [Polyangia bacterium]|nr:hypothetical protein [Polyangia bacterium]